MHDIRAIRENPAAFDAALAKRGLSPLSPEILALDEARRAKITASETAQAEANAAAKQSQVINMTKGIDSCKEAVNSGYFPLFRYDPRLAEKGKNPLQLDSKEPTIGFEEFANNQNRFRVLKKNNPENAEALLAASAKDSATRYDLYKKLAEMKADCGSDS